MSELLKFKAGRVQYNEETGEATPIRGQGNVVLKKSSEDEHLLAIQWQPRAAYGQQLTASEELMILPGDVAFEHMEECTTGRVISLRFESSGQREMYWLQDPVSGDLNQLSDADRHILERLNELANQELDEDDEDEEADEPMSVAPPAVPVVPVTPAVPEAALARAPTGLVSVASALNSDRLSTHIANASDAEIDELLATVGSLASTRDELAQLVCSPHFRNALHQLDIILHEGGTQALSAESGLQYEGEGAAAFLNAFRKQYKRNHNSVRLLLDLDEVKTSIDDVMQRLQEQLDLQWDYLEARDTRVRQVRRKIIDIFGEMASEKRVAVAHTEVALHDAKKIAYQEEQSAARRSKLNKELDAVLESDEVKQLDEAKRTLLDIDKQIEELKQKRSATRQQVSELESVVGARKSRVVSQLEALPPLNSDIAPKLDSINRQLAVDNHELAAIDQGKELWQSVVKYLDELDARMDGPPIQIESALEEAAQWLAEKGAYVEQQHWGPLVIAIGHELEVVREALDAITENK